MRRARPIAVLAPPAVALVLAATAQWLDFAGFRSGRQTHLFDLWHRLALGVTGLSRPAWALPCEILALVAAGAVVIAIIWRLRVYWAGLFTASAVAIAFEVSWLFFFNRHQLIDAETPALGLLLVFVVAALAVAAEMQLMLVRLRIAFSDSLPRAALEKIARKPEILSMDGETRTITYLVRGVRQLAGLAAEYRDDPKGFTQLMNEVLSPLLDQALAHGGIIDRLTADGFAAFWNAPLDDPAHAIHACEAANGMSVMAARVNDNVAGRRTPGDKLIAPLEIGVGLATGSVIASGFGGLGRLGYGVNGDAVVLASRIQALSPQYGPSVIVSEETRRVAERSFAFLEVDYIAAGSDDTPVRLFALLGSPVARSSPKFKALNVFHEHIFNSLRSQQWGKARDLIEQCRKLSGASPALYDLHLARIKYFESNPPGPNWDGAFRPILK